MDDGAREGVGNRSKGLQTDETLLKRERRTVGRRIEDILLLPQRQRRRAAELDGSSDMGGEGYETAYASVDERFELAALVA